MTESAMRLRERAARKRETASIAREESAHLREVAVRLREETARLRDEIAVVNERAHRDAVRMQRELEARNAELRTANEQLVISALRAQELQEAAQQAHQRQEQFMAMVAHELRNPLAPILSATAALRRRVAGEPLLAQLQGILQRQVTQMARLLDDLLDVARITSGKVVLQRQPIAVAEFINQAVESCRPLIDARNQSLVIKVPAETVQVDGDPVRLAQIFGNLLTNASKYTQDGGAIAVRVRADAQSVVLRVVDNGSGIAPGLRPHLFELFIQGHDAHGPVQGGLGIGLAVVHEMVSRHSGTIEVASNGPGQGSEFIVTLPRLQPRAAAPGAAL